MAINTEITDADRLNAWLNEISAEEARDERIAQERNAEIISNLYDEVIALTQSLIEKVVVCEITLKVSSIVDRRLYIPQKNHKGETWCYQVVSAEGIGIAGNLGDIPTRINAFVDGLSHSQLTGLRDALRLTLNSK